MLDVRMYLFARSDIASMNPGKQAAQMAHAANKCVWTIRNTKGNKGDRARLDAWENQAKGQGFGTTLCFTGKWDDIICAVDCAADYANLTAGTVVDPSYPVRDGVLTHVIKNVPTAAWIFGDADEVRSIYFNDLRLMP